MIEKGKMIFTPKNSSIIAGSTALEVLKKHLEFLLMERTTSV